jgi:hypothetical protein
VARRLLLNPREPPRPVRRAGPVRRRRVHRRAARFTTDSPRAPGRPASPARVEGPAGTVRPTLGRPPPVAEAEVRKPLQRPEADMEPRTSPLPRRVTTLVLDRPAAPGASAVPEASPATRCRPIARHSRAGGRPRSRLACGR